MRNLLCQFTNESKVCARPVMNPSGAPSRTDVRGMALDKKKRTQIATHINSFMAPA